MTQKEYKEKLYKLEEENKNLKRELEHERDKVYNHEQLLEQYYITNKTLNQEKEFNRQNELTIDRLQKTIYQYEKILDKFTISYGG